MRPPQQLQRVLIPQIDASLKADRQRTLGNFLQQHPHLLADTENLIDEINIVDPARDQLIDLLQHLVQLALPELIAE